MPTLLEIKDSSLIYCKKYDVHCPCLKCEKPIGLCIKSVSPEETCSLCKGPYNDSDVEKDVYICMFHCCHPDFWIK